MGRGQPVHSGPSGGDLGSDGSTFNVKITPDNVITVTTGVALGAFCVTGQNLNSNATGTAYFWYASDAGGLVARPTATSPGEACG